MSRPRVLVVADYYLPGFRAGGPVRAISNTIGRLASGTDFFVVTRDHDADGSKYGGVEVGRWTEGSAGRVLYAPRLTPALLQRCVADTTCDVIWLNSFFSRASIGVLVSRRMGRIRPPVLLAPRGEFSPGALALKRRRKAIAMRLLQRTGCLRSIHWLASSARERDDIARAMGASPITRVPESVAAVAEADEPWQAKSARKLKAVFAGRIAPTKNLHFLLEVLAQCHGDIHLDIVGPLEDADYWARCQAMVQRFPATVSVEYTGEATHRDLQRRLSTYDVMILPTLGENFGHVVVEAWAAGCPVLLSDRTPWRQLRSQGLGWDVPLDHQEWIGAIRECLDMSADTHLMMRRQVREQARRVWQEGVAGDALLRRLFEEAARRPESGFRDDAVPEMAGAGDIDTCT
jgi:glycosyltransferase involved in cell wall biosynthesis